MQVQLVLTLAASFLAAPVPKGDDTKDAQAIQGTWLIESAERDGKPYTEIKGEKLILKDGKLTITSKNKAEKGTYKIDPTKKPRAIDITPENESKAVAGIYLLEGDTLKICFVKERGAGPTEFNSKGASCALIVLKRQKK